jgi:predicted DCC family thiol-disulfide oxidoreductase YuxK
MAALLDKTEQRSLVLYDGMCGLCNRVVGFLVKRDRQDRLRFAALQSGPGREILARHDRSDANLETVLFVQNWGEPSEELLARSDAAISATRALGGIWRLAIVFYVVPRLVRDAVYNFIARRRYRLFGKFDTCPTPDAAVRHKFLDA